MQAVDALRRLGGVGSQGQIVALSSRRKLREALRRGEMTRISRGRYTLPDAGRHRRTAARLAGVTSHLSAAQHHGWPVKWPPGRAWVTVPRNRKVDRVTQATVCVVWADLAEDDVADGVTTPVRTVLDCARRLPFDEALAVADSALRAGDVTQAELVAAAAAARGPGSAACRRVATAADARAANPFESVLRAIVLEFPDLDVEPQAGVQARGLVYHPDLVDVRRRIAIEADSHEFHTEKEAHGRDCVRYTALTVAGWRVLRFTWDQVMHSPAYVHAVLADLVSTDRRQAVGA